MESKQKVAIVGSGMPADKMAELHATLAAKNMEVTNLDVPEGSLESLVSFQQKEVQELASVLNEEIRYLDQKQITEYRNKAQHKKTCAALKKKRKKKGKKTHRKKRK